MSEYSVDNRIPVILCIDVEPDDFYVSRTDPKPWKGYEMAHPYLKELRAKLEDHTRHAVHFYWSLRMDPQIKIAYGSSTWVMEQYPAFLEEYRVEGDDLGVHVHTYRWSDHKGNWIDDCGSNDWVIKCLDSSTESYYKAFGEPCRTLRFGNFWSNTVAVNRAEELGFLFDLTIEPGLPQNLLTASKPPPSGTMPDYHRVPRAPYNPSYRDFRKPAKNEKRQILMIPLTSSYLKLGFSPKGIARRLYRLYRNGFHYRLQNKTLSMWKQWSGVNNFSNMLDRAIRLQEKPYLAFAIHSNFTVTKDYESVDSCLKALLTHSDLSRFVFCTPKEAIKILQ